MKPIATDNYDFERLIKDGYAYVDKTDMLWKLANGKNGTLFFISRPRRFGKSLMLSTFKYLFQGRKDLFKGLKIEKKWDWSKTYPVIELNMRSETASDLAGLEKNLRGIARRIAKNYGLNVEWRDCGNSGKAFSLTLEAFAKKHGRFVLLIDEYDVPLQKFLQTGKIGAARAMLHDFYGGIKDNVGAIRFMMMTGVSKFTKLSVFSALNNLTDLTMDRPEFAGMLGYTRKEIETTLAPQLGAFAKKLKCTREEAMRQLLCWYDSYRFSPYSSVKVLNPVSVGQALPSGILTDYWSKTGIPTLIVERLQASGRMPSELKDVETTPGDLDVCDATDLPWIPLLYQSGYLTIKDVKWSDEDGRHVTGLVLGTPNREVRENLTSNFWRTVMHMEASSFDALVDVAKRQLAGGGTEKRVRHEAAYTRRYKVDKDADNRQGVFDLRRECERGERQRPGERGGDDGQRPRRVKNQYERADGDKRRSGGKRVRRSGGTADRAPGSPGVFRSSHTPAPFGLQYPKKLYQIS